MPTAAAKKPPKPTPPRDWGALAKRYVDALSPEKRAGLAHRLRLPVEALDALPLIGTSGANTAGSIFTFPECDPSGRIIGITERIPTTEGKDRKKNIFGGNRGLTIPVKWRDRTGPVFPVEGPTDVLALSMCGLATVGRFSNLGGTDMLAVLLADWPSDRGIIVIGENDEKPDGRWPGREGAQQTATELARLLGRPVQWALTPNGVKDSRDWVANQVAGAADMVDWPRIGQDFLAALEPVEVDPPPPSEGPRPRIVIGPDEHRVNDEAAASLGADSELFQRGGVLVRVASDPPPASKSIRRPTGPRIEAVAVATLRERLTRWADWWKIAKGEEDCIEQPAHPPPWSVQAVHCRGVWPTVRVLEAVVEYPVFLPDGRIFTEPGYDSGTGILYHPPAELVLAVPNKPTKADAVAAAHRLLDVVSDFPFAGDAHKAAWLASVLTPLSRFAFSGPSPLFLAEGNCRGVGKGLLLDVAGRIVTGQGFAVCTFTNDREELRKLITSIAAQGDRLVLFDNLDGPFGGGVIDMALTGEAWQGRLLGTNTTIRVPLLVSWYASGNNVSIIGDTARRICPFRLETPLENPERRGDFRRQDLLGWVGGNRAALLTDALTILKGWHLAGRPDMKPAPWGSFSGWSGVVRNAIMWCGLCDPGDTRNELQERADTAADSMRAVLIGLEQLDPERYGLTAAEIIDRVFINPPTVPEKWFHDLRTALEELLPRRESRHLGYRLRTFRRRIFAGRYLDSPRESHGSARWVVYPQTEFRGTRDESPEGPFEDTEPDVPSTRDGALFEAERFAELPD